MAKTDGGKGSAPRPFTDYDKYSQNWDQIFKKEKDMVRVSGVPYEVELDNQYVDTVEYYLQKNDMIAELEHENRCLRARIERLEEELRNASRND